MLTNLQQSSIEQRIDRVAGEYYRQLSIVRIQDAVYFAEIPDKTLEYFCHVMARECITHKARPDSDNQIVQHVLQGAWESGRTTREFVEALSKAIEICTAGGE